QHFGQAHFVCTNSMHRAHNFAVFGPALNLMAHQDKVHGADTRQKKRLEACK
ncbi:hypothetical protein BS17DRAFT_690796, partial [Gyrodon lividus]